LLDRCPTAPGTRERQGCPERVDDDAPSPAARLQSLDGVIEGVNFDVDRASLRPESLEILNHAVAVLREHPTARIEISGHTDSAGEYEHNLELSRSRAETVRDYLVDRGIAAERLETVGHGPDRPIADNRTRAGRLRNRRIEFKPLE
jgi:OOP family OmpA-OmpF porin